MVPAATATIQHASISAGMENIYNGLMRHGFSESEAGQVLGENWFNFLKDGLEPQSKG